VHTDAAVKKPDAKPLAECQGDRPPGNGSTQGGGDCHSDADCNKGKNGRCHFSPGGGPRMPWNNCTYDGCFADADCSPGNLCECDRERGNYCLASNCRSKDECADGASCDVAPNVECFGGSAGRFCRTPKDACKTEDDCPTGRDGRHGACTYLPETGAWGCKAWPDCPVG
jgi:hypothetical protein